MAVLALGLLAAACASEQDPVGAEARPSTSMTATTLATVADAAPTEGGTSPADECAHVINATARRADDGTFTVSATVESADTGWDKYADLWTVSLPEGEVLGERVLLHPHENEQPFTRSLADVEIPDGAQAVLVAARDSVEGFCGEVFELDVSGF